MKNYNDVWIKLVYLLIILATLIFVSSCEQTCPQMPCPPCDCGEVEEPIAIEGDIQIHTIDVNQGDAIFIDYGDYEALIDCGKDGEGDTVVNYIKDKVEVLDYLIVTHTDADHIGGCDKVLRDIPTDKIYMDGQERTTTNYREFMEMISIEEVITAKEGDIFDLNGNAMFTVLQGNTNSEDPNQNSIVLRMDYKGTRALFTGDCDRECEDKLLSKEIDVDILKVAHHGTRYGTSLQFLQRARPETAIITVGDNNYGHPSQETLDRLDQMNVEVLRTDERGNIIIDISEGGYSVK